MEGTKLDKQCACCHEPGKLELCGRCKDTHYCSRECQLGARPEHKHLCAEDPIEKAVLRAGWLLKKLLLASRQRASCKWIRSWYWNEDNTCLTVVRTIMPGDYVKFSPTTTVTEEEREMIWAARYCKGAVAIFSDLLKILLQDVSVTIREVNLSLQAPKKRARIHQVYLEGHSEWLDGHDSHYVFLVSSAKDQTKRWFIDPTGAQFGIRTPVHKVDVYMKKWGKTVDSIAPPGVAKAQIIEFGTGEGPREVYYNITLGQGSNVADATEKAVKRWTKQTGLPSSELLAGSDSRYQKLEPLVLKTIDEHVEMYDKATELAKMPPLIGWTQDTLDSENKRISQKQAWEMLKYKFNGTWA